jgi:hypothetical protein
MKLRGIMLGSDNPKALGEFYTKIFGEPGWQQGEWYGFMIGESNLMIGRHSEVKGKNQTPGRSIINFDSDDVKADFEKIKGSVPRSLLTRINQTKTIIRMHG